MTQEQILEEEEEEVNVSYLRTMKPKYIIENVNLSPEEKTDYVVVSNFIVDNMVINHRISFNFLMKHPFWVLDFPHIGCWRAKQIEKEP